MYHLYTYICTLYIQVYYFNLAKIFNGQLFYYWNMYMYIQNLEQLSFSLY